MPEQLILDLPHRTALGRDDFLVGDCNRLAVDCIDRWPDWPAALLVLSGPAGCGKTHLAHVFLAHAQARLIGAEDLGGTDPLVLAGLGPLLLDDADRIADEAGLFHLCNAVKELAGHLLLTASAPARQWGIDLADLTSRLRAAPAVEIGLASDDLLAGLLAKLFRDRQVAVDEGVINYLVKRMERSFVAAGQLVQGLDQAALREKRRITVALARRMFDPGAPG